MPTACSEAGRGQTPLRRPLPDRTRRLKQLRLALGRGVPRVGVTIAPSGIAARYGDGGQGYPLRPPGPKGRAPCATLQSQLRRGP